ncbi:MAG: hypothetical protein WAS49_17545, partial [Candidatus Dechloromonas phosphoritropha]
MAQARGAKEQSQVVDLPRSQNFSSPVRPHAGARKPGHPTEFAGWPGEGKPYFNWPSFCSIFASGIAPGTRSPSA